MEPAGRRPAPEFCRAVYGGAMWEPVRCGRFVHRGVHKALVPPREPGADPRVLSWL